MWHGVIRNRLEFAFVKSVRTGLGIVLLAFALIVYPVWSTLAGHGYPELPAFGLLLAGMAAVGLFIWPVRVHKT